LSADADDEQDGNTFDRGRDSHDAYDQEARVVKGTINHSRLESSQHSHQRSLEIVKAEQFESNEVAANGESPERARGLKVTK
jgi:hypothetical protein